MILPVRSVLCNPRELMLAIIDVRRNPLSGRRLPSAENEFQRRLIRAILVEWRFQRSFAQTIRAEQDEKSALTRAVSVEWENTRALMKEVRAEQDKKSALMEPIRDVWSNQRPLMWRILMDGYRQRFGIVFSNIKYFNKSRRFYGKNGENRAEEPEK